MTSWEKRRVRRLKIARQRIERWSEVERLAVDLCRAMRPGFTCGQLRLAQIIRDEARDELSCWSEEARIVQRELQAVGLWSPS